MNHKKFLFVSICLICFLSLGFFVTNANVTKDKRARLAFTKPTSPNASVDLALGMLDAGKLSHAVFNDGRLGIWDYIPEIPAGFYKGFGYIPDLEIMVGIPEGPWTPKRLDPTTNDSISFGPTVSESHIHAGTVKADWGPRKNSKGELHSGDMTVDDIISGSGLGSLPVMATSTLPETWPKDADGNRYWPGPWAKDPETGEELEGVFTSDKDVFFSITDFDLQPDVDNKPYAETDNDDNQGYAIGMQIDVSAYSYGRSYAEDFIFFVMKVINRSKWDYHGIYVGFYLDVDAPAYNLSGYGPHNNIDWMDFITSEYDAENDTTYYYNMGYIYDHPAQPDADEDAYTAVKLLDTPRGPEGNMLGLTDWHWFDWNDRPGVVLEERKELIQYKVMSGDTSGLVGRENDAYFHPNPAGVLDPHFDSAEGIQTNYPDGLDCTFIMSSGPFELAASDTTTFSFCLMMGDNLDDLKLNARSAQLMYELNYLGADPPKTPTVTAVPGDGRVSLYWDNAAENSQDIMTRYNDFEGYKIYRTTSDPANNKWGDKILDGTGGEIGFIPIAQFDLNNSISGLDPEYPHLNLGSNTGLVHSWIDSTVENGVTYWYSVTAYDRGVRQDPQLNPDKWANLNSLECAKGLSAGSATNLVEIVPGVKPVGFQDPEMGKFTPNPDSLGKGEFNIHVIDPIAVKDNHSYYLTFDDTTFADQLIYSVFDETMGGVELVSASDRTQGEDSGPIFDGIRLEINRHLKVTPRDHVWIEVSGDTSDYEFGNLILAGANAKPADYELRFLGDNADSSEVGNKIVPFQIWNVTEDPPQQVNLFISGTGTEWQSSDAITFLEPTIRDRTWKIVINWAPSVEIDTTVTPPDTIEVDPIPPSVGDVLKFRTNKPLTHQDHFRFTTKGHQVKVEQPKLLKDIRVVPNPYVVSAEWELNGNISQLQFTNLPPVCNIYIYTITGDLVNKLHHESTSMGYLNWNMLTFNRQELAYGLYIYVVETPDGDKKVGKFAVIK